MIAAFAFGLFSRSHRSGRRSIQHQHQFRGDHKHGSQVHPGNEEGRVLCFPGPGSLHLDPGDSSLLHQLSRGIGELCAFPGDAHRPRGHLDRAGFRHLRGQRRQNRAGPGIETNLPLQGRRQVVPALWWLSLQTRLPGNKTIQPRFSQETDWPNRVGID